MRPLPEQAVHLPFEAAPYRMAMDLVTVPEAAWFELDQAYKPDMAERRRLLETAHDQVFAAGAASGPARAEALALIAAALTAHHPDWFSRQGQRLHNQLSHETWDLEHPALDPLELAGRLVQEDLCVIQNGAEGPVFTAAVLCFPSRWRLIDKIGKPLVGVHGPVPFYADRLARPVDRFMRHLKVGPIASRLNWSVLDDPALFQPEGKWRVDGGSDVTPENAGSRLFLRVERQTLRRLPASEAVLFGIRVHVYPLTQAIDRPARAAALAAAVRALPVEILRYKSVLPFRNALLGWLEDR
ncbi:heme-dependent oxidative N-demethylase family protein [Rhodopila sp.]|uniref:heme-dependent oxidative N-demethylase family protein n=1 Tax=Rhodopila sp. TaxID=2480087 RepID=UPI003D0EAD06